MSSPESIIMEQQYKSPTISQITNDPDLNRKCEHNSVDKNTSMCKDCGEYLDSESYLMNEPNTGKYASYYDLDSNWETVQDIIEAKEFNFSEGNILKSVFRLGANHHSSQERDLEKIIYFAERQLKLIKASNGNTNSNGKR